jgi:2-phospho-L-lactate guanylyltransferase (CobY/MobA/RfbA family)
VFRFGEDSHQRHLEGADGERAASSAASWPAASFALDIDTADDLAALREVVSNRADRAVAERTAAWVATQDTGAPLPKFVIHRSTL